MYKKLFAILLAALMLLSLAACGDSSVEKTDEGLVYYLDTDVDKDLFNSPENTLDVEKIYSTITYNEQMLYGRFLLKDFYDDGVEEYAKTAQFADLEYFSSYSDELETEKLSKLPVQIESGPANMYGEAIRIDRTHHWAYVTFARETGTYEEILCSYTVSGNQISFTPVDYYKETRDENYTVTNIEYQIGKDSLTYTFSLRGPNLTLSIGEESIALKSYSFSEDDYHDMDGYLAEGCKPFENIDSIMGSTIAVYLNDTNEDLMYNPTYKPGIKYTENGVLTLIWGEEDADGNDIMRSHQFVCFGSGSSLTLVDNENIYYYTESYSSRELLALSDGLTAEEIFQASTLSDDKLKDIVEKKANLLEDLAAAFDEAGLNVAINTNTGEIALDSTILFGVDESTISEEGKTFLQKFMGIYTTIVFNEKYNGFVSSIAVEGHTDTQGTYEHNVELSQARANSVKDYCISAECGVDAAYFETLQTMLEAVGYSYDRPVYQENGEVDMDASRRVSFRFIINFAG